MPAMPRPKGKAKKIAYDILGTPPNMQDKPNTRRKEINAKIEAENTQRVR